MLINLLVVAGHETTSTATTWALYALSLHPEVQTKLREELLTLDTETPDMDELKTLPYLDCVLKEVLRVYAPVVDTERMATQDDMIPLEDGGFIRFVIHTYHLYREVYLRIGYLLAIG